MRILLVCAAGMSTSLLTNNMKKNADPGDVIDALPAADLAAVVDDYDVILVGPQIRYRLAEIEKVAAEHGKPAAVVDMRVYGTMNGEAAMAQARALVGA
jgi:PTS system cellobiose-specific IIB component